MDLLSHPALWGAAGGAVWGAPEWASRTFSANNGSLKAFVYLLIAAFTGALAATACTMWVLEWFMLDMTRGVPIAAAIGLAANPAAPRIASAISAIATTFVSKGQPK